MTGTIKELIPKMMELDTNKIYELKEVKKKRSLNANSYCWVLLGKIADRLGITK